MHRDCYGIDEIPPGDIPWYCQPCAEGINSKTVKCALCPFPGGAFSRIEDPISKSMSPWCHVVCATWLPDVTIRDKASQLSISLHEMDRSRENLKCVLCGERGVSIQCLHPTCYRAFHPWCALRAHSTRVASGLGADGLFATYCKQHMSKYTHEDDGFIMIKENPDAGDQEFQKHLEKSKSFCPEIATCSHKETKIDLEPKEDVDEKKTSAICDPEDVDEDEASSATCDPEEKEYTDEEEGIVTSSGEEEDVDDEDDVDDIDEESSAACDLKAKENVDEEEKCAACDDPEPKEDVDEEKRITPRTRKRSRINPAPKKDVVDEERITPRTRNRMRINPEPKEDVDEEERITPRTRKRTRIETSVEDLIQQKITPRPRKKKKIVKEPKPEAVHVECTEESSCAEFWETIDMDFFHDPEAAIPQKYCAEPTLTTTRMSDANVVVQTLESQQQPCHPMFEIEQLARSESKTDHIRVLFTKDESQQCFAMEYSVVPNDERKLVATRCESVPYAGGTAPDPQVCQIDIEITKLYHQIGELERMNRCRLEELKKKVPIRARNNYPEKEECQYLALRNSKLITASLKRGIVDRPIVEEGSCVVCFDGSSNEDNQIVFCDSCNIAVHQSCFGVFQVPDGDFYCDRCQEEDHVHIENRACTLCPLKGGAFKRTTCGRWVHVFCALWCPKATIRDGSTLSPVDTVPAIESNRGVVCSVCCIPVGWTTTCAHEGCEIAMHPYCGWRDGMYGHVADAVPSNLQLQLYCGQHTPEHAIGGTRRENQAKMRLEILNSIRTSRKKRHKLDRRQRIIRPDVYRQDLCAVCFTKSEAALIQCTSCGLVVHPLCSMSPISPDTIHYQCTACVANVSRCSLCPRTGGFLVGIENTELWAHVYCIVACSALSGSNPNAAAELRKKINSTTTACSFCTKREVRTCNRSSRHRLIMNHRVMWCRAM